MMCGTPDQVYRQFRRHYDYVGGYGHLLIMGQAGHLDHDDTVAGIRNFAREVYPRLKEEFPDTTVSGQFGDVPPEPPMDAVPKGGSGGRREEGAVMTPLGAARGA